MAHAPRRRSLGLQVPLNVKFAASSVILFPTILACENKLKILEEAWKPTRMRSNTISLDVALEATYSELLVT